MTQEAGDTAALTYHGTGQQETLASEMVWSSAKEESSGTLPSTRATGILLVWKSTHRIPAILCDPRRRENLEMRVQTLSIRRAGPSAPLSSHCWLPCGIGRLLQAS